MGHDHGHSHGHNDNDYYLEQLFTVGVCGALGTVGFLLWQRGVLSKTKMLADYLQWTVVAGSVAILLALVVVRAIALWREVGEPAKKTAHDHDHAPRPWVLVAMITVTITSSIRSSEIEWHDHAHSSCLSLALVTPATGLKPLAKAPRDRSRSRPRP